MLLTKQRSNGARAPHALVKEIVMYVIGINVLQCKIIWILVFKCEATENVLLPAAFFFYFYNPWETQREIDIFWWKRSGSDIWVHKQKITLKKNGELNKIVVSNWLFNSTEAGFHSQNATFTKKGFFDHSRFNLELENKSVIKLHFARNLHKYWNLPKSS